jgi:predicted transposase YdaD
MIFKVLRNKKIHLLKLSQEASFEDLKKAVSQAFKLSPQDFSMCYVDEEGDDVSLNDEFDYSILVSSEQKIMKIKIEEKESAQKEEFDNEPSV